MPKSDDLLIFELWNNIESEETFLICLCAIVFIIISSVIKLNKVSIIPILIIVCAQSLSYILLDENWLLLVECLIVVIVSLIHLGTWRFNSVKLKKSCVCGLIFLILYLIISSSLNKIIALCESYLSNPHHKKQFDKWVEYQSETHGSQIRNITSISQCFSVYEEASRWTFALWVVVAICLIFMSVMLALNSWVDWIYKNWKIFLFVSLLYSVCMSSFMINPTHDVRIHGKWHQFMAMTQFVVFPFGFYLWVNQETDDNARGSNVYFVLAVFSFTRVAISCFEFGVMSKLKGEAMLIKYQLLFCYSLLMRLLDVDALSKCFERVNKVKQGLHMY